MIDTATLNHSRVTGIPNKIATYLAWKTAACVTHFPQRIGSLAPHVLLSSCRSAFPEAHESPPPSPPGGMGANSSPVKFLYYLGYNPLPSVTHTQLYGVTIFFIVHILINIKHTICRQLLGNWITPHRLCLIPTLSDELPTATVWKICAYELQMTTTFSRTYMST